MATTLYPDIEAGIREVAHWESQRRGSSDFKVDTEDVQKFWSVVTAASSEEETTEAKIFQNRTDTEYTMPYTEKRTSSTGKNVEGRIEMVCGKVKNVSPVNMKLQGTASYNRKETVETQVSNITPRPNNTLVIKDTIRHTTKDLEVRALGFYYFRVYPGHPMAKGAAIGAAAGAGGGVLAGGGTGAGIGSAVGLLAGPVGVAVGAAVGAVIGAASGAVVGGGGGSAVGAGFGVRRRKQQHFTITAKDVFATMPGYREEGKFVYCTVRHHSACSERHFIFE